MNGPWWLIFPIMSLAFGLMGMWIRHRRSEASIDLVKAYLAQGKEPPAELLTALCARDQADFGLMGARKGAVMWGAVASGFLIVALLGYLRNAPNMGGFLITGIILGCVAIGWAVVARMRAGVATQR